MVYVYIGFLVTLIVMRIGIVGKISIEASMCFFTPNNSSQGKEDATDNVSRGHHNIGKKIIRKIALPVQFLVVQWCRSRYGLGFILPNIEIFSVSEWRSTKQTCTDPRGLNR